MWGGELLCNRLNARRIKRADEVPKRASLGGLWAAKRFFWAREPLPSAMERLFAFAGDGRRRQRREGGPTWRRS